MLIITDKEWGACTVPVSPGLVVANGRGPPATVSQHCHLHWAVVVQPAEELGRLPVLDRVMRALCITSTVRPNHLRLDTKTHTKRTAEVVAVYIIPMSTIICVGG